MKKTSINIALFPLFLLLLGTVFLNLLSSCSDKEDEDEFVDPQNFCGSYSEDKLSLTLNQNKMPGAQVELVSVSTDGKFMMVRLSGVYPTDESVEFEAAVEPGQGYIELKGATNYYECYNLSFSGVCDNKELRATLVYEVTSSLTRSAVFDFTDQILKVSQGTAGTVEWEGKTYEKVEFVESVLEYLNKKLSENIQGMRLDFNRDGALSVYVKKVNGDFTEWPIHLTYWFRKYSHGIYIAMDRETNNAFLDYLSGDADFSSIPTVAMTAEHYCLPAFYTQNDEYFSLEMDFPTLLICLGDWINSGMLNDKEAETMKLFYKILSSDSDRDMAWRIHMIAKRNI